MNHHLPPRPRRSRIFTKRGLYFFVFWVPALLIGAATFYGIAAHAPFAVVHSWNARHKSTSELLRGSWKVPVKLAAWMTVELCGALAYDQYFCHAHYERGNLSNWLSFAAWPGIGFGVALAHLCVGWLLLITLAVRWPLDRHHDQAWP